MRDPKSFAIEVFKSVDNKNIQQFTEYLTENSFFVFGNAAPVISRKLIAGYVENFLSSIRQTTHDLSDIWQINDFIITRLRVTYARHDDKKKSYPCVTVWQMKENQISDYRIYIDNSTLFSDCLEKN